MTLLMVHNLIDPTDPQGRTYKEVQLATSHSIPIGTLVEAKWDVWYGDGACCKFHGRLWVVNHTRDCDGTPLYDLSQWKSNTVARYTGQVHRTFSEDQLTPVEITE